VTCSSTPAPDLGAICRTALGCDVVSSHPVGAGGNSRVFRVELDHASTSLPRRVVVKFYRRDAGDTRDRLGTEFESLRFLWQNNLRSIPSPLAIARDRQCAIYEYIDGDPATCCVLGPGDIDAAVDFLRVLKQLCGAPGSDALPPASEACFSLSDILASVDQRLERLRHNPGGDPGGDDVQRMRWWVDQVLAPLACEVSEWCRDRARQASIAFDEPIGADARTLSPSDFGFHNAIRRPDGALAFVDFEYFGWDDPAKAIVDFLLHPGMTLDDRLKRRFAACVQAAFAGVPALAARTRIVYPLFGLKWALILLNDFLPERFVPAATERRALQLGKAQTLLGRVAGEYAHNPFDVRI
jgi:Phosphotransferase enzyme family